MPDSVGHKPWHDAANITFDKEYKKRKCNEICQPANQKNDATQNVNCFSALRPENFSAVDMAANES